MPDPTVPLVDVPEEAKQRLIELGAPATAANSKLYQALSNEPDLLLGWLDMAWRLRMGRRTPVRLRELMIVHGARLANCPFEMAGHSMRARDAGVTDSELAELVDWRSSTCFTDDERLAFDFMEQVIAGHVSDETNSRLEARYDAAERIELILTAAFYCMVPRTIDALRLTRTE
jgi:AhpD family alkylhydroperoxidase